jgi:hypothetical protein
MRVLLEADVDNIRRLVVKADRLLALNGHKQTGTVALVEGTVKQLEENPVQTDYYVAYTTPTGVADRLAACGATSDTVLMRSR